MTCPSCGGELDAGPDPLPGLRRRRRAARRGRARDRPALRDAAGARQRVEPLRDIPGLRKQEKTWRDEVQERVRVAPAEARRAPACRSSTRSRPRLRRPRLRRRPRRPLRLAAPGQSAAAGAAAAAPRPPPPTGAAARPSDDFVTMRLTRGRARRPSAERRGRRGASRRRREREASALPRATRRADALARRGRARARVRRGEGGRAAAARDAKPPPLERPALALERAQAAAVDAILFARARRSSCSTSRAARRAWTSAALAPSWPGLALYLGPPRALLRRLLHRHDGPDARQADDRPAGRGLDGPPAELPARDGARAPRARRASPLAGCVPGPDGLRPRPPRAPRPAVPHARRPRLSPPAVSMSRIA